MVIAQKRGGLMLIGTDQQCLERVVKEQTVQIKELQRLLDFFERKVDYLEDIYDHEEVTQ